MVLGTEILLDLVEKQNLVEGLCDRELKNPEGAGFDLQLGEVFTLSGKGFLGIDERTTPKAVSIAKYQVDKRQTVTFEPGKYYVVKTTEKVNLPPNITALFRPRTTLLRSGVKLITGNVAPGYCGELNFGLENRHTEDFDMELGARFVHIMFYLVEGKVNTYKGQWQGGRTDVTHREKQV